MLPNVEGSGKTKEQVALFFGALLKCIYVMFSSPLNKIKHCLCNKDKVSLVIVGPTVTIPNCDNTVNSAQMELLFSHAASCCSMRLRAPKS